MDKITPRYTNGQDNLTGEKLVPISISYRNVYHNKNHMFGNVLEPFSFHWNLKQCKDEIKDVRIPYRYTQVYYEYFKLHENHKDLKTPTVVMMHDIRDYKEFNYLETMKVKQ